MKPNTLKVLEMAIEDGIARRMRRRWKHSENPPTEAEITAIAEDAVEGAMDGIYEWFEFDDLPGD